MKLFYIFIASVTYYQLDNVINDIIYQSNKIDNHLEINSDIELFKNIYYFSFLLFSFFFCYSIHRYHLNKFKMIHNIYICIIYLKYSSIYFFRDSLTIEHQEIRKIFMWLFTTPVMLNMLTSINKINFMDIYPHIHTVNTFLYLIISFFPNTTFYQFTKFVLYAMNGYYIYHLSKFTYYRYTRIFIGIWSLFGSVVLLKDIGVIDNKTTVLFNLISDILAKFMVVNLISEFEDQREEISANMDIQSLQLITTILKNIDDFKESNRISKTCEKTMNYLINNIKGLIPKKEEHDLLKIELLKKILPYDLEDKFLLSNVNRYKKHDNICVLFTDIVSYSKISHEFDEQVIYQLLNDIYIRFDFLLRRYKNLQKIETIGDSYMVVGDLTNIVNIEESIQSMVSFAFDLIDSVKTLKTPNGEEIQIRIGIHNGPVVVGILGMDVPRLCVIGNTVNMTSRLESTSKPSKIQISESIYSILLSQNNMYQYKKRKNILLKNIGVVNTFFVYKKDDKMDDDSPVHSEDFSI